MLELIFVIVILGIVSSIGAELIANVYESYIVQRAQHRASLKTELAATQIANRLASAIPGTVVRKLDINTTAEDINTAPDPTKIDDYDVLQWVGTDTDSFKTITSDTDRKPGWSGFCDVDSADSSLTGTTISTPGSNLGLASTIITELGGTVGNSAIYYEANKTLQRRDIASFSSNTKIDLDNTLDNISEHYKLAWTSYALVVDDAGTLSLHYNFEPTRAIDVAGSSSILLRNVSTFKFRGDGRTIRFKICVDEDIGEDFNITICKEKAVF